MKLFPYQETGVDWLADPERAHKLLADDMGLGKSAQAIRAAAKSGAAKIAVICPSSLQPNWLREIERFTGAGGFGFSFADNTVIEMQIPGVPVWTIVSYDMAARGKLDGKIFDLLICDEAHYLKSKDAKRTLAIYGKNGLARRARRVWLLTGTPTPNHPAEMWTHLAALAPDVIPGKKEGKALPYWGFVTKYCKTIDTGFGIKIVGGKNLAELRERLAPFILRRKKEDVLKDLPPISFDTLPVAATAPAIDGADYARIVKALERGIDGLAEIAPHVAQLRRLTGLAKVAGVIAYVKDFLEGSDRKIVLFAHHKDVIAQLSDIPGSVSVHGGTTNRQAAIDAFQHGEARVFIGQITAAGTGLTLTAASDLLFVESSWVPAENEQAAMRIHRIGQKKACSVRFATIAGSIDEQIAEACARKLETIREIFA